MARGIPLAFSRPAVEKPCDCPSLLLSDNENMSTATVEQIEQDFAAWLAAVRRGETVAIVDKGQEIARLTPPVEKAQPMAANPWANRMAELEAIFPEPVLGASKALEEMRADRL